MPQYALTERRALAQTLRRVGPDAQTLCGEWTTAQLAAHLVLRERSVVEAAGRLPVAGLRRRAERVVADAARTPYAQLVDTFERGPSWRDVAGPVPVAWLWSLPPVAEFANLLEYLIHHEDVRRAQPDWIPRALAPDLQRTVWRRLRLVAPLTLRHVPVGLVLRWPGHGELVTRRGRADGARVTVTGDALELALVAFGRLPQAQVTWDGADDDVSALQGADISF